MALTITVTKKSVTQTMVGCFQITANLTCADGATEVINQDFTAIYKTGANMNLIKASITDQMQRAINAYKAGKTVYDATALNTAITDIQNSLVG